MNVYAKQKQTHRYKSKFIVPKGEEGQIRPMGSTDTNNYQVDKQLGYTV